MEAEILAFEKIEAAAIDARQFGPAVSAKTKASALRKQLADITAAIEAAAIEDPIERLEFDRQRAEADGSWVAVTHLIKEIAEAKAKRAADDAKREEAARRDPVVAKRRLVEALRRMPDRMREDVIREATVGAEAPAVH